MEDESEISGNWNKIKMVDLVQERMQRSLTNVTKVRHNPHPLVDRVGEEVTQKHLKKLI